MRLPSQAPGLRLDPKSSLGQAYLSPPLKCWHISPLTAKLLDQVRETHEAALRTEAYEKRVGIHRGRKAVS